MMLPIVHRAGLSVATGRIIERWDNPFNGRAVRVVQVANDPVSSLFPAPVREYTLWNYPSFATAPDRYDQPSETSGTYCARLEKAGKLPAACR